MCGVSLQWDTHPNIRTCSSIVRLKVTLRGSVWPAAEPSARLPYERAVKMTVLGKQPRQCAIRSALWFRTARSLFVRSFSIQQPPRPSYLLHEQRSMSIARRGLLRAQESQKKDADLKQRPEEIESRSKRLLEIDEFTNSGDLEGLKTACGNSWYCAEG